MKKILGLVMAVALLGIMASAQQIANYQFNASTRTYVPLVGGTVIAPAGENAPEDDGSYNNIPIGFTFWYMGKPYTDVAAQTNGFLTFRQSSFITGYWSDGTGGEGNNLMNVWHSACNADIDEVPIRPLLAPFWDDMIMASSAGAQFSYLTTGAPGSRVFTAEWNYLGWDYSISANVMSFQVILNEADMSVEYNYSQGGTAPGGVNAAAIGMTAEEYGTAGTYLCLSDAGAAPTASSTVLTLNLTTRPATDQLYRFAPQFIVTPADPINMAFVDNGPTSIDVRWDDNSVTETYFYVETSPDGVVWSPLTTVTSTTQATTGTQYSHTVPGLLANTTYYYRVLAGNEASASSGWLSGNHTTLPFNNVTAIATGNWSNTATWSSGAVPTINDHVTIAGGYTVTVDAASLCQDLTLGNGAAGVLALGNGNTLTVNGSLYINATGSTTSAVNSVLIVGGNMATGGSIVNNGTLDLSNTTLVFAGANNVTWTGTGTNTVSVIALNKGSRANVVEILPTNITLPATFLDFATYNTGTVEFSGTYAYTGNLWLGANGPTFPPTLGIWLNNPNFTVNGRNGTIQSQGLIRISNGTWNVGTNQGNSLAMNNGSAFRMDGGTLTIAGRLAVSSTAGDNINCQIHGGTINLVNVQSTSNTYFPFDLRGATSVFKMTGGTINILRGAGTAGVDSLGYRCTPGTAGLEITGGTVRFGNPVTPVNMNVRVVGRIPTFSFANPGTTDTLKILNGGTGNNYFRTYTNTTIPANKCLNLNGRPYRHYNEVLTIDAGGSIYSATGGEIDFCNVFTPSVSGYYVTNFTNNGTLRCVVALSWNDTTYLLGANPANFDQVIFYQGGFANAATNMTIGYGAAGYGYVDIDNVGYGLPWGFDGQPNFNNAVYFEVDYTNQMAAPYTWTMGQGYEVPAPVGGFHYIGWLGVYNTGGGTQSVTQSGSHVYCYDQIDISGGMYHTNGNAVLVDSAATAIAEVDGYVDGWIEISRAVGIGSTETFKGLGASLANVLDDLGDVTIDRYTGTMGQNVASITGANADTSISRTFWVQSTNPPASGCDLTINWLAADVPAGYDQTQMQVWRSPGGPNPWSPVGPVFNGTGLTTTLTGVTQFSNWTVADINNPLPVELLSFNVQAVETEKKVNLTWSTASEKNSYQWQIERSTDGKTFAGIATLNAAGNSAGKIDYTYTDEFNLNAGQEYYYRLASVTQSGSRSFFGPIKISVAKPNSYQLASAYPNPFSDKATIKYQLKDAGKVSLKVYNLTGQLVKTLVDAPQNADFYSVRWNGTNDGGKKVAAGLYLYRLEVNGFSAIKKAAILR